jgi:hypothetical protein
VVYRAKDGTEEKVLDTFDMNLLGKTGDSKSFDMRSIHAIIWGKWVVRGHTQWKLLIGSSRLAKKGRFLRQPREREIL